MSFMKAYAYWATEQIQKDYPELSWNACAHMVMNSNVCKSIERYSLDAYLKAKNKETIGGIK